MKPFKLGDYLTFASVIKHNKEVLQNKTRDGFDLEGSSRINNDYFPKLPFQMNFCVNVTFDFGMRKWTDNEFIEDASFINNWNKTFNGFWDNLENSYPKQPYQPTLIAMGYRYSLRYPSKFNPQPYVVQFGSITGPFSFKNRSRFNLWDLNNVDISGALFIFGII